jgi:hypothetical protein
MDKIRESLPRQDEANIKIYIVKSIVLIIPKRYPI